MFGSLYFGQTPFACNATPVPAASSSGGAGGFGTTYFGQSPFAGNGTPVPASGGGASGVGAGFGTVYFGQTFFGGITFPPGGADPGPPPPAAVPVRNQISAFFVEEFNPKRKRKKWRWDPVTRRMVRVVEDIPLVAAPIAPQLRLTVPSTQVTPAPRWTTEHETRDLRAIAKLLSSLH